MEVKLGKHLVELKKPTSFMLSREVTVACGINALRGLGAALGTCWSGKPLKATLASCKYDTLAYGGAVVDELIGLGIPEADVYEAAGKALDLIVASMPREEAVASAEGFTAAAQEPSTP